MFDPSNHLDAEVTISGEAADARAGAAVILPDGSPIYLIGQSEWDKGVAGHQVEVTGVLRQRSARGGSAKSADAGAHSDDIGATFALEDAVWARKG